MMSGKWMGWGLREGDECRGKKSEVGVKYSEKLLFKYFLRFKIKVGSLPTFSKFAVSDIFEKQAWGNETSALFILKLGRMNDYCKTFESLNALKYAHCFFKRTQRLRPNSC